MTDEQPRRRPQQRKQVLLRLDPSVHDAITRWAEAELRSTNAQIEFLLRRSLAEAGRLPGTAGPLPRRGRPPNSRTAQVPGLRPEAGTGPPEAAAEAGTGTGTVSGTGPRTGMGDGSRAGPAEEAPPRGST